MIVTRATHRQRRNDLFSTKAATLKLILAAAAIGTFMNLLLFQRYYSQDDIYLTHYDIDDDDAEVQSTDDEWNEDGNTIREEWEPIVHVNKNSPPTTNDKSSEQRSQFSSSCLKARNNTVPKHLYGKLQKPYLNLGLPKMGTSSIHNFFECGGLTSVHFRCNRVDSCARCMKHSVEAGGLPLDLCEMPPKEIDVYAQMDDGTQYFPQIELLDELVAGYPKATLFLMFRSTEKWYNSLQKWPPRKNGPHMTDKLRDANITGFPSGVGKTVDEFADWYCKHVERVRDIVARNPSLTLVEVDIEDSTIAKRMSEMFEIDESCWGHSNANPIANPDLNLTEVQVARKFVEISKEAKEAMANH
jgi:hypothetical protein